MEAFAPGSVTALFAPSEADEKSLGVSMAIDDGVVADVTPAAETRVAVAGEPTDFEPVTLVLDDLGVEAAVDLTAEVPIGCGFGASGAATLATALAANEAFDLGRDRENLLAAAHRSEVAAGTGLGDVFIQEMGGLVMDDGTGIERFEPDTTIGYESYGGIDTAEALGDEALMERVTTVGTELIRDLVRSRAAAPSLVTVLERGWEFARAVDLPTAEVTETVAAVEAAGGTASMAMVGQTVFGVGGDGVLPHRTRISHEGARLL
ncbi:MAG: GHMP kinase [Haloferacaceae archaeon]